MGEIKDINEGYKSLLSRTLPDGKDMLLTDPHRNVNPQLLESKQKTHSVEN